MLTIDCSPETRLTYLSWAIATISMLVKHSITSTHSVQYYHQNAAAICCAALKKKVSHSRQVGLVKNQLQNINVSWVNFQIIRFLPYSQYQYQKIFAMIRNKRKPFMSREHEHILCNNMSLHKTVVSKGCLIHKPR